MAKKEEEKKPEDHFQIIEFGGKILSVSRRSSCWTEEMGAEGNVEITSGCQDWQKDSHL